LEVDAPVVAVDGPVVAVALDGPVVALPPAPPVALPPRLTELDPENEALSLLDVDVVGPTRTLLSMFPTLEPPLTSDWPWMEVAPELDPEMAVLSPFEMGATVVVCAPLVVELLLSAPDTEPELAPALASALACANAASGERVIAAMHAAVVNSLVFMVVAPPGLREKRGSRSSPALDHA
jgi:hypothetical protein